MTQLLARMPTVQRLVARFRAIWYVVFAGGPSCVGHILQQSLSTGAVFYEVGGSRTAWWLRILLMTRLLTSMFSAVKGPATQVGALERAGPLLHGGGAVSCGVVLSTLLFIRSIAAQDVLLDLAAVTSCRNTYFARATRPVVTWLWAAMLSTRQEFSAELAASPTVLVISVYAASCY
jgi:hypothetical protein